MYWRNVSRNLQKSSPGRRWGRHRDRKAGPAERIIPVDLVSSTTRHSRLMESREREERSLTWVFWIAFLLVAGIAFLAVG